MKTWHFEAAVVGVILLSVAYLTGNKFSEYIGAGAVFFSFMMMQVASRLEEKEALRHTPEIQCFAWNTRYLYVKEVLWFTYFIIHESYAALVGTVLFLLYPLWRKYWRQH